MKCKSLVYSMFSISYQKQEFVTMITITGKSTNFSIALWKLSSKPLVAILTESPSRITTAFSLNCSTVKRFTWTWWFWRRRTKPCCFTLFANLTDNAKITEMYNKTLRTLKIFYFIDSCNLKWNIKRRRKQDSGSDFRIHPTCDNQIFISF